MGASYSIPQEIKSITERYFHFHNIEAEVICYWRFERDGLNLDIDLPVGVYNEQEIYNELYSLIDKTVGFYSLRIQLNYIDSF